MSDSVPLVVLVIGIPGAGKTTVARSLAARFERAACVDGDLVQHHFTVSGLVGPGDDPADEAERQLWLRWTNCAAMALNFWRAGFMRSGGAQPRPTCVSSQVTSGAIARHDFVISVCARFVASQAGQPSSRCAVSDL